MASFLPYIQIPSIPIYGELKIQSFGVLVAAGVVFGAWVGRKRAVQLGIDENEIRTMTGYLLVFGFLGAHLFDVFFYQADEIAGDPLLLIKVWDGISSYGGFIGAFFGWWLFTRLHKVERPLVYADITIWGTLPGFTFGRLGCTTVFDHPGSPTESIFGMDYPFTGLLKAGIEPGTRIHNLGFYEFVFLLVVIGLLYLITANGKKQPVGFVVGFVCVLYGPVRFWLDSLRYEHIDPRYLGLTFAQHMAVATTLIGIVVLWRAYKGPQWDRETAKAELEFRFKAEREEAEARRAKAAKGAKSSPAKSGKPKPKAGGSSKKKSGGQSKKKGKKK